MVAMSEGVKPASTRRFYPKAETHLDFIRIRPPSLEEYLRKTLKVTLPPMTSIVYSNMAYKGLIEGLWGNETAGLGLTW
jgi:hypothetical protein